ncbi:hypothetical protein M5D96_009667 [Drosophila gunungcola]|uniref:Uncharacterized protein n=1 Tax=Drosophila gunungcola TaxID=103775 RepID=A0A9P9YIR8_9MUSC|nr:hypothetical protein M5D96_009667 [Drosophila gunungcola]
MQINFRESWTATRERLFMHNPHFQRSASVNSYLWPGNAFFYKYNPFEKHVFK